MRFAVSEFIVYCEEKDEGIDNSGSNLLQLLSVHALGRSEFDFCLNTYLVSTYIGYLDRLVSDLSEIPVCSNTYVIQRYYVGKSI